MSLYHEAAKILTTSNDQSLRSRIFGQKDIKSPPNQLYALALETSKWSAVIKEVVEAADLFKHEPKLTPILSLLLVHDLLLTKGGVALPQSHGLRASVERHKGRLRSELTRARLRRKAVSLDDLRAQVEEAAMRSGGSSSGGTAHPRWIRINTLRNSVEKELASTFADYVRAASIAEVVDKPGRHIYVDPDVPHLVAVTAGIDMSKTAAYASGSIVLQDKASCFPAYLLDPRPEDGDVVDACAAPGNKTTHLAAILHQNRRQQGSSSISDSRPRSIFAFERDVRRAQTLEKMVARAGAAAVTHIAAGQDFLRVDPLDAKYRNVGALLLDPSCSGSGIVGRDSGAPELHLPVVATGGGDSGRGRKRKRSRAADTKRKGKSTHNDDDEDDENGIDDDENGGGGGADGLEANDDQPERDLATRLEALASFQLSLLEHALHFPAAKKVTYSTCSVHGEENEAVVAAALRSRVARRRGWRLLPREQQVAGLRAWPLRGLAEAAGGDEALAEACIRARRGDGRGVMGFFVAAFVRDVDHDDGTLPEQPVPTGVEETESKLESRTVPDPMKEKADKDEKDDDDDDDDEWNGFED